MKLIQRNVFLLEKRNPPGVRCLEVTLNLRTELLGNDSLAIN